MVEVTRIESREPQRCALCHADLDAPLVECPACRTVLHEECRGALRSCPTLGCVSHASGELRGPLDPRVRRLGRSLVVALVTASPALVALFGFAFGFGGMARDIGPDTVALCWIAQPLLFLAALVVTIVLCEWGRRSLGMRHAFVFGVASIALTFAAYWNAHDVGVWAWERAVLAPRAEALRRSLAEGDERPALTELKLKYSKRHGRGVLLYAWGANPLQAGWGVYVPDEGAPPPRDEYPFAFSSSSVPGFFYFHEYP